MVKQLILIILLSLGTIFFKSELTHVLDGLIYAHHYLMQALHGVFADDNVGRLIQDIVSLLLIPFLGGLVVALLFWLLKRSAMPHAMVAIWVVWLVLATTLVTTGVVVSQQPVQQASPTKASGTEAVAGDAPA
ncbi:MAG: hypothetical protein A3F41_04985 [Coxiella sp. RIFCSPHIGHO2_12_FULL_44_14]|nr:MAG: hypothetical protein A3F41_04985 [Coxiella sp. RIFCSPHIGHO2_12_FULL_44_14]